MTATEIAEWNEILRVQLERDHEAAIHEDRLRDAEMGCSRGHFGWAAGLTRAERDAIESRCR